MNKKKIDRIPMGSVDIFMMEFTGTAVADIPDDDVIEVESNLVGRTKDGGEIIYSPTYYKAKSDDGIATRNELTDESVKINFGIVTFAGDTITKIIPTATVTTNGGKRRTTIGGISKDNGKSYLVRALHKDKVAGDIRYTIIGKNVNGFAAAYKKGQETVVTPAIDAEPFDDGTLLVMDEDSDLGVLILSLAAGSTGKTKVSTVTPTAASGNTYKYKIGSSAADVTYDNAYTSGWTALTPGTTEISATAGQIITVIEVDSSNKAKAVGSVTVVDNIG